MRKVLIDISLIANPKRNFGKYDFLKLLKLFVSRNII